MTPDEKEIHRTIRRAVDEAIRESFESLKLQTRGSMLPPGDNGKSTSSAKQPPDEWITTRDAAKILTANDCKCSEYTVRVTVCKHELIVKKRRGGGDGYGPILISLRSLYAYMNWRKTPTKEYDDISAEAIQRRKEGLAKRQSKAEAKRKKDQKRD